MARISPPEGSFVFLDHQPEQYAAFNRLYGALWSTGSVDEATKEAGRLRNAALVDCGLWKNLRFAGAKQQGLTEDHIARLGDRDDVTLPVPVRLAARYAEVLVTDPTSMTEALRSDLDATFTAAERVELTLTIALASAFSRAAITWGPPPEMPVLDVPTPRP